MSISLLVYSPEPPVDRSSIANMSTSAQLPEELRWEVTFVRDRELLADDGPITDGQVFGWRPGAGSSVRAALEKDDRARLDQLYVQEAFAVVQVYVRTRDTKEWGDVVDEETIQATPPRYQDQVKAARTHYSLETSAGRNDATFEFQRQLWSVVAAISNGLAEDPQEGMYASARDQDITYVDSPDRASDSAALIARGNRFFNLAAALLILIELITILLGRDNPRTALIVIGIVAMNWYFVRTGESWSYWGMLVFSSALGLLTGWHLVTPPTSPPARTAALLVWFLGFAATTGLLLQPAVRAYVRSRADPLEPE